MTDKTDDKAPAAPAPDPTETLAPHKGESHKRATVRATIREWVDSHIAGGEIARHTESWNALHKALPALVEKITGD